MTLNFKRLGVYMTKTKHVLILLLVLLISLPYVLAANSVVKVFSDMGLWVNRLLRTDNFVFVLAFFAVFMVLYATYAAGLRFAGAFSDEAYGHGAHGGRTINRQGTAVAIGFALLSTVGIFWLGIRLGIKPFLLKLLTPFKDVAGIMFGMLFFLILYYLLNEEHRDWRWACLCAGLACLFASSLMGGL